jgi:hypothetical protein
MKCLCLTVTAYALKLAYVYAGDAYQGGPDSGGSISPLELGRTALSP